MKRLQLLIIAAMLLSVGIVYGDTVRLRLQSTNTTVTASYTLYSEYNNDEDEAEGWGVPLNPNSVTIEPVNVPTNYDPTSVQLWGTSECGNSTVFNNQFEYGPLPENPNIECWYNENIIFVPGYTPSTLSAMIYTNVDIIDCEVTCIGDGSTTVIADLRQGWNEVAIEDICINSIGSLVVTGTHVDDEEVSVTTYDVIDNEMSVELVFENKALHNKWNWESFPMLDANDTANNYFTLMVSELTTNIHDNDYDMLNLSGNYGKLEYFPLSNTWSNLTYPERSSDGFKIQIDSSPAREYWAQGTPVAENTAIDIPANEEYYIGYWMPHSEDIDVAFGEHWDKVKSIKSEKWTYLDMSSPRSEPVPSMKIRPLHYGDGYVIELTEAVEDFQWSTGEGRSKNFFKPDPENFEADVKADYEVIDVMNIDPTITEIGVFAGDKCLGSVVVEEGAEQILVYSDRMNRDDIPFTFEVITGRGNTEQIADYSVFNEHTGRYDKDVVVSGNQNYSRIILGSPEQQEDITLPNLNLGIHPNPFNPNTTISYNVSQENNVSLEVYNVKGQLVKQLFTGKVSAGEHSAVWNGKDDSGNAVSSGIYYSKLTVGDKSITKKMILMK